jgi:Domain of unknown function (DUF4157)
MRMCEKARASPERQPELSVPRVQSAVCEQPAPAQNAFFGLQHSAGNRAVAGLFASGAIQASLRVSRPGDADEIEADRVADRVVSTNGQPAIFRSTTSSPGSGQSVPNDFLHSLGPGQPLDAGTRSFMESRFGRDFSGVSIHTGDQAAESAQSIQARAFAAGSHVVFDKGEYHPQSTAGKRLLAHELTHVAQQSQAGQSNIVHRAPPPQQQLPAYTSADTFTLVKTSKLNADGAFTKQVLFSISTTWTRMSAYGGPNVAQRAVDLLETSDTFVKMANELDAFHTKKGNPAIRIVMSSLGSKFVPAGTPWQDRADSPVENEPDEDTILIDYSASMNLFGPKPQQLAQFASTFIHETSHAYHRIKGITRGGLQGDLEEEQRTRKDEIAGLQEIKGGTTNKDEQAALDQRIADIQQGPLTNRAIAEDFVSGGEGTYLEAFFLDSAINDLTTRKAQLEATLRKANSPIPDSLTPITKVTPKDLADYDFGAFVTTLTNFMTRKMPKSGAPKGHTPSKAEADFIVKFSNMKLNLKQLTDFRPPALSDDYRYVFLYLALVKAYGIKAKIRQAWEDFENDPDPNKKKSDVMDKNARDLLGVPHPYSGIRG